MPFMRSESCSFIWHPKVVTGYFNIAPFSRRRTLRPRRSELHLSSVVGRPRLPDHGDLDLAGVLELLLDLARDLVGEQGRAVVVERVRLDHHADLATGLHR